MKNERDRSFFCEVRGLVGFGGGGYQKIWLQRGGAAEKGWCVKGGHQKSAFKFGSDSICNNANISARMPKNSVSKVLKIPIFPGESGFPSLLRTNGNSTSSTVSLQHTARGMSTLFWPLLVHC